MSITHTAVGGDKNPQLIKANEETNDWIYHIPPYCCLLLLLYTSELNVLMVLNTTGWLETQMCSVSWLIVFQWTQKTLRVGGGALYRHHHHQICVFTVRKLTWCPLNHSCFPLLLQRCLLGRVLSAPSPTSSVSGKSPEQQEKPLSCGKDSMYKKKYLLNFCLRLIALQCVGQKGFHEQTRVEWEFISKNDGKVSEFYTSLKL